MTPIAREAFLEMLVAREQKGLATYGTTLQTHNGRDAHQDALEEAIDLWQYVVQASLEHADLMQARASARAEIVRLTDERDTARRWAVYLDNLLAAIEGEAATAFGPVEVVP